MIRLAPLIDEYNRIARLPGEPVMTQRRLAELAGVNEVTVHRHVTGKNAMSLSIALTYARVLRCRVEELVDDGEAAA